MFSYSSELTNYDRGVEGSKVLQLTSTFNNKIRDWKIFLRLFRKVLLFFSIPKKTLWSLFYKKMVNAF